MSAALGQLKCKRLIALHLRSTAPKKMTCTFIVQVFFLQGSKGLERDVKKTAQCAVFSPRRVNRVSGAKKSVRNACARRVAEQVPSTAPKKMTCTFIVQVFFLQGSKGLERDVKKTAQCAVFSPRRVNRVSGAKKSVRNACARRVAEQVPSTAPTEKTILLSSFFHFLPKMMRRCCLFQKTHFKPTEPL